MRSDDCENCLQVNHRHMMIRCCFLAEEGFYLQQQEENSISVQADLCSGD